MDVNKLDADKLKDVIENLEEIITVQKKIIENQKETIEVLKKQVKLYKDFFDRVKEGYTE